MKHVNSFFYSFTHPLREPRMIENHLFWYFFQTCATILNYGLISLKLFTYRRLFYLVYVLLSTVSELLLTYFILY